MSRQPRGRFRAGHILTGLSTDDLPNMSEILLLLRTWYIFKGCDMPAEVQYLLIIGLFAGRRFRMNNPQNRF